MSYFNFPKSNFSKDEINDRLCDIVDDSTPTDKQSKKYGLNDVSDITGNKQEPFRNSMLYNRQTGSNTSSLDFNRSTKMPALQLQSAYPSDRKESLKSESSNIVRTSIVPGSSRPAVNRDRPILSSISQDSPQSPPFTQNAVKAIINNPNAIHRPTVEPKTINRKSQDFGSRNTNVPVNSMLQSINYSIPKKREPNARDQSLELKSSELNQNACTVKRSTRSSAKKAPEVINLIDDDDADDSEDEVNVQTIVNIKDKVSRPIPLDENHSANPTEFQLKLIHSNLESKFNCTNDLFQFFGPEFIQAMTNKINQNSNTLLNINDRNGNSISCAMIFQDLIRFGKNDISVKQALFQHDKVEFVEYLSSRQKEAKFEELSRETFLFSDIRDIVVLEAGTIESFPSLSVVIINQLTFLTTAKDFIEHTNPTRKLSHFALLITEVHTDTIFEILKRFAATNALIKPKHPKLPSIEKFLIEYLKMKPTSVLSDKESYEMPSFVKSSGRTLSSMKSAKNSVDLISEEEYPTRRSSRRSKAYNMNNMFLTPEDSEIYLIWQGLTIYKGDLRRLEPDVYLNDSLIDLWVSHYLQSPDAEFQRDRVYSFSCQFLTKIMNERNIHLGHQSVARWTKRSEVDLFNKDFIFIPINEASHWSLACVVRPGLIFSSVQRKWEKESTIDDSQTMSETQEFDQLPCIMFMDSLGLHQPHKYAKVIRGYLYHEWLARKGPSSENYAGENSPVFLERIQKEFDSMPIVKIKAPTQQNGYDCGVYVTAFVKWVLEIYPLSTPESVKNKFIDIFNPSTFYPSSFIPDMRKQLRILTDELSNKWHEYKAEKQLRKELRKKMKAESELHPSENPDENINSNIPQSDLKASESDSSEADSESDDALDSPCIVNEKSYEVSKNPEDESCVRFNDYESSVDDRNENEIKWKPTSNMHIRFDENNDSVNEDNVNDQNEWITDGMFDSHNETSNNSDIPNSRKLVRTSKISLLAPTKSLRLLHSNIVNSTEDEEDTDEDFAITKRSRLS